MLVKIYLSKKLKNFIKKILLLSIIFYTNFLFGQSNEDFTFITNSTNGAKIYAMVEKENNIWVKIVQPIKTIKNKKGQFVKVGGSYDLMFITLNCSDREYDRNNYITYNRNGNLITNDDSHDYGIKVIPGSVMSVIFDWACTK